VTADRAHALAPPELVAAERVETLDDDGDRRRPPAIPIVVCVIVRETRRSV
jgi:hypothetical protein